MPGYIPQLAWVSLGNDGYVSYHPTKPSRCRVAVKRHGRIWRLTGPGWQRDFKTLKDAQRHVDGMVRAGEL